MKASNLTKTFKNIPVVIGPRVLKLWNLLLSIEKNATKIDYWMGTILEAYPDFEKALRDGPQAVCEDSK